MTTSVKRINQWIAWNCILWATSIFGLVCGVHWAAIIFYISIWIVTGCHLVAWIVLRLDDSDLIDAIAGAEPIRVIPGIIDCILDSILIGILVTYGHWFYGALLLLHIVSYESVHKSLNAFIAQRTRAVSS